MSTQMTIELSAEKTRKHAFYSATLDLPATDLQIEDALSRARFQNVSSQEFIDIEEAVMFDPSHLSVTADDIHALNYLAKRLDSLSEEDEIKFEALYYARTRRLPEDEQIQVGSVINMTYGLDMIPLAVNVGTDYELGRFVVENDFDERFENVPDAALSYLDYKSIGKEFRERDDGVFYGKYYVPTRYHELKNVYDGSQLLDGNGQFLSVSWSKVNGANSYQLVKWDEAYRRWSYIYTGSSTQYLDDYVWSGKTYKYQVRAMYVTKNNGTAYSSWSSVCSYQYYPRILFSGKRSENMFRGLTGGGKYSYEVNWKTRNEKCGTVLSEITVRARAIHIRQPPTETLL